MKHIIALLVLLTMPSIVSTTTKPSGGYDIAACGTNVFMVVHFDVVGDDLKLTMVNDEPGEVMVLPVPRLYTFKDENKEGRHFISPTKKSELILQFDENVAVGVQKLDDHFTAMLFGFQASGDKLIENVDILHATCEKLKGRSAGFVQ